MATETETELTDQINYNKTDDATNDDGTNNQQNDNEQNIKTEYNAASENKDNDETEEEKVEKAQNEPKKENEEKEELKETLTIKTKTDELQEIINKPRSKSMQASPSYIDFGAVAETDMLRAQQEQQLKLTKRPWKYVKVDDINKLKKYIQYILQQKGEDEFTKQINENRGAFRETLLHISILYGADKCAKYLITDPKCRALCFKVYQHIEYFGESILHMVIAQDNQKLFDVILPPTKNEQKTDEKDEKDENNEDDDMDYPQNVAHHLRTDTYMTDLEDDADGLPAKFDANDKRETYMMSDDDTESNLSTPAMNRPVTPFDDDNDDENELQFDDDKDPFFIVFNLSADHGLNEPKDRPDAKQIARIKQNIKELAKGVAASNFELISETLQEKEANFDKDKLLFTLPEINELINNKRVVGIFFDPQCGAVEYGQYALTFAVVLGRKQMIRRLYEYGANFKCIDTNSGDTIFHYIARYNLVDIFDFIFNSGEIFNEERNEKEYKEIVKFLNKRNNDLYTCLQFAVLHKNVEMFRKILDFKKQTVWAFGNVSFVGYPLNEIDTHGNDTPRSVLEIIMAENALDFISEPVIEAILRDKWQNYAKLYFRVWCISHLLYVLMILILYSLYIRVYDDRSRKYLLEIFIYLITVCKVFVTEYQRITEIRTLSEEHGFWPALSIYLQWNLPELSITEFFQWLLLASNLLLVGLWVTLIIDDVNQHKEKFVIIFMTFSFLAETIYILWFAQVTKLMGRLVVTTLTIITGDIIRFCIMYSVILLGFAGAVSFTYEQDIGIRRAALTLFYISIGAGDAWFDEETDSEKYENWQILFNEGIYFVFLVISSVLMFNLLIAVFSETIELLREQTDKNTKFQRATIILSIERKVEQPCFKRLYRRTGDNGKNYNFNVDIIEPNKDVFAL